MREPNSIDDYVRMNPKTGLFEPVWMWRAVLPFWLGPDPQQSNVDPIVINAAGTKTKPITYKLPHSSQSLDRGGDMMSSVGNPLMINRLVYEDITDGTPSANWTIFMEDLGEQLRYMNFPVHIRTFAGGINGLTSPLGMLPALLAEPLFLPTRHNLMTTFDKISGAAVNARFFPVGGIFDTWSTCLLGHDEDKLALLALIQKLLERRKQIYPYWFTTDGGPLVVPSGQTVQQDITVGDDGHFEATDIMAVSMNTVNPGAFEVEFYNPDTRQTLMNGRIQSSMIGDAFNPQPFPASMIFTAGSTVRFIVKDLAATGNDNTVYLTLRGRRIRAPLKSIEEVKRDLHVPMPQHMQARLPQQPNVFQMAPGPGGRR